MSSSQSKRKRDELTKEPAAPAPSSRRSRNTLQESQDLMRSIASENSPDIDSDDDDYNEDEDQEREATEQENPENPGEEAAEPAADVIPQTKKAKVIPKRSEHWEHFREYVENGVTRAECNYCKNTYATDTRKNGCSNLGKHRARCSENPENKSKGTQSKLVLEKTDGVGNCKVKNWTLDLNELRSRVCKYIVGCEQSFSLVEEILFRDMFECGTPTFKMPCRSTITRDAYAMYLEERSKLKGFLEKNCQRISLTTDTWTSIQKVNYMALTAHFVDNNWNLQKRMLSFCVISGHKGEDIARDVEDCLASWNLCGKVFSLTVDNVSSNDSACLKLKDMLIKAGGCIARGNHLHMRCVAHIANRIVKDGLNVYLPCVDKVRLIVKYVRSSDIRQKSFKDEVKRQNITCNLSLVSDVPTRWNSTYLMLDIALKFKKVFPRLTYLPIDDEGRFLGDISDEEWTTVEVIVKFLKQFYDFTNTVSGSLYVTVSNVYLYIGQICNLLNQAVESDDPICRSMAIPMKKKCDKYWGDVEKMNVNIFVGVILDPRYKFDGLKCVLKKLFGEMKGIEYATLIKESAKSIFNEYREMYAPKPATSTDGTDLATVGPIGNRGGDLDSFVNQIASEVLQIGESSGPSYSSEFDRYFHELICRDHDALTWWKLNGHRFPILARMARDVLAVPVTTVPSESAFSTGGRTVSSYRSSLSPKMVEALVCTQDWIRAALKARLCSAQEAYSIMKEHEVYYESEKITEDANQE